MKYDDFTTLDYGPAVCKFDSGQNLDFFALVLGEQPNNLGGKSLPNINAVIKSYR